METYRLSGVTHDYRSIGLSTAAKGGILLAQAISSNDGEAGTARIDSSFQIRYQEDDNGTHAGEDVGVASFIGSLSSMGVTGESGSFAMSTTSRSTTHTIQFQHSYTQPVVFVQAVTAFGNDPVAVIPVATSSDFAVIAMPEGPSYDGIHYAGETIHWVVIEAGSYYLGNSTFLEAGLKKITTSDYSSSGMTDITPTSAGFSDTAAFFAQPQSASAATYRGARIKRTVEDGLVTSLSARHMRSKTEEVSGAPATTGYIGYLAVGQGIQYVTTNATANTIGSTPLVYNESGDLWASSETPATTTIDPKCTDGKITEWLKKPYGKWGDSTFNAGYEAKVGIGSEASTGYELWMGAQATGYVTVFGKYVSVFDAGAMVVEDGGTGDQGWIKLLGVSLWNARIGVSFTPLQYTKTFVKVEKNFYGFDVAAEASGTVGIQFSGEASGSSLSITGKPFASLNASASLGIGAFCATLGIVGDLTLVELSVPVTGSITLPTSSKPYWGYSYGADVALATLSGELAIEGNLCGLSKSWPIFSWDGLPLATKPIMSGSGCL
ncbi:Hypothetical protein A7982_01952 [Minicystis rosea]|nr:Hypothetical protein A7982_01952 [Minicystis rosea]